LGRKLYICSVPIGHDGDITSRAHEILSHVATIFCEDTRVTKMLLNRLGIFHSQHLVRMDQYQEKRSFLAFDKAIEQGPVAYVSDAGTPGLSDPGAGLVQYARAHKITVSICPGVSSVSAFISGCGLLFSAYHFGGFLPKKQTEVVQAVSSVIEQKTVGIWFESPKRILRLSDDLKAYFPNLPVIFAKELTKKYEAFFWGSATDVHAQLYSADVRGEWVILIDARSFSVDYSNVRKHLAMSMKIAGLSGKQVKLLAPLFDCPKNELYDIFQAL
jgi:16S rRNA (cytidine1402-2'-O)-methyltransferase